MLLDLLKIVNEFNSFQRIEVSKIEVRLESSLDFVTSNLFFTITRSADSAYFYTELNIL